MPGPILDLSTLAPERPTVRIKTKADPEGKLYEMAVPDDLSLADQQFLYARAGRLDTLMSKAEPTTEERQELTMVVDKAASLILRDVPDQVMDELPNLQKQRAILVFLSAFATSVEEIVKAATEVKTIPISAS